MDTATRRLTSEAALIAGILLIALVVLGSSGRTLPFQGDEGRRLTDTRFFSYLFLEGNLSRDLWGDSYWTHVPSWVPATSLVAGSGRAATT